jgi:hydrogenase expression/formation protein HypE
MKDDRKPDFQLNCPLPLPARDTVLLGHGSGGKLTTELIRDIFLPAFSNPILARLDDQAVVSLNGLRLAFTTDSFVVSPLFFPGGDIGSLAVHGTVNDLAMGGAEPLFLSAAFIIEEGLPLETLARVVASLRQAAAEAGVTVVAGDTKVVERGSGDGLFINTSGLGRVPEGVLLSADQARPGDQILLSGTIGEHGIAVLAQREGLEFDSPVMSDTAPLHTLWRQCWKLPAPSTACAIPRVAGYPAR